MKRICYKVRCASALMILAIAWVSWFHASVYDPKFICIEVESGFKLESVSSGCCGTEIAPIPTESRNADDADCGDCEDLALNLVVTRTRATVLHSAGSDIELQFPLIDLAGDLKSVSRDYDGPFAFVRFPVATHVPIHLRTCAIPLIC